MKLLENESWFTASVSRGYSQVFKIFIVLKLYLVYSHYLSEKWGLGALSIKG